MMLHRHFETGEKPNMTTLADVTPKAEKETAEVPEAPKRRGRQKKTEE